MGRKSREKKLRKLKNGFSEDLAMQPLITKGVERGFQIKLNQNKRKFSDILDDFISPLINYETDTDEQIKTKISWGGMVWNKVMSDEYPEHSFSVSFRGLYPKFLILNPSEELLNAYIHRKKEFFNNDKFFIADYSFQSISDGFFFSIAVLEITE